MRLRSIRATQTIQHGVWHCELLDQDGATILWRDIRASLLDELRVKLTRLHVRTHQWRKIRSTPIRWEGLAEWIR